MAEPDTAQLVRTDWAAVGVKANLVNLPPSEEEVRADSAKWMFSFAQAAELDLWTFPSWVFPTATGRMSPRVGAWYLSGREDGEASEKGSLDDQLLELYVRGLRIKDFEQRNKLILEAVQIHTDKGPFFIGTVGGLPSVAISRPNLKNFPPTTSCISSRPPDRLSSQRRTPPRRRRVADARKERPADRTARTRSLLTRERSVTLSACASHQDGRMLGSCWRVGAVPCASDRGGSDRVRDDLPKRGLAETAQSCAAE